VSTSGRKRRQSPGITVYRRGGKWSFIVYLEPDILSGKRDRLYRGGFNSEDAAWSAAIKARTEAEENRYIQPTRRTLEQFLTEWLDSIEHAVKPTTYANYVDNVNAYIVPVIGHRRLQDLTVRVLNAFYRRLLESGRRKPDNNAVMYEYWKARRHYRGGRGPTPM
jgi:hypothetical protein